MNRLTCFFALLSLASVSAQGDNHDVVIYGGTCAAITSALQVKKMGKSVIIVSPDKHLGGLSSGGLGFTDTGNKAVIGGLARDFYHRIYLHYQKPESWKQQKQSEYGNKGQAPPRWTARTAPCGFSSRARRRVFEDYVKEFSLEVVRDEWLDRCKGVKKEGDKIVSITTLSGKTYAGKMFIDATYEGDLMAAAGVAYSRRSRGEQRLWRGAQWGAGRRAASSSSLRCGEGEDQPLQGARRSEERRATAH